MNAQLKHWSLNHFKQHFPYVFYIYYACNFYDVILMQRQHVVTWKISFFFVTLHNFNAKQRNVMTSVSKKILFIPYKLYYIFLNLLIKRFHSASFCFNIITHAICIQTRMHGQCFSRGIAGKTLLFQNRKFLQKHLNFKSMLKSYKLLNLKHIFILLAPTRWYMQA